MSMYAKLMSRITESSLMEEVVEVRYCFMVMLAMADERGFVIGTDVAIARRMNISVSDFRRCVCRLMLPDPNSNSTEHEGRRLLESEGERGYFVVNYTKYQGKRRAAGSGRDKEKRRKYMADLMKERREAKGGEVVVKSKPKSPANPPEKPPRTIKLPPELAGDDFQAAWMEWLEYRRQAKHKPYVDIGVQRLFSELAVMGKRRAITAINHSIAQGWQGIHEPKPERVVGNGAAPELNIKLV